MTNTNGQSISCVYSGTATFATAADVSKFQDSLRAAGLGAIDHQVSSHHYLGPCVEFKHLSLKEIAALTTCAVTHNGNVASFSTETDPAHQVLTIKFTRDWQMTEFMAETAEKGLWVLPMDLDEDRRTVAVRDISKSEADLLTKVAERTHGAVQDIVSHSMGNRERQRQYC